MLPRQQDLPVSQKIGGARQVVGGRGEARLKVGVGQTSPAHSPDAVPAVPGPDDLLDPYPVDCAVPFDQAALSLTPGHRLAEWRFEVELTIGTEREMLSMAQFPDLAGLVDRADAILADVDGVFARQAVHDHADAWRRTGSGPRGRQPVKEEGRGRGGTFTAN